jgi:hypothetical protein
METVNQGTNNQGGQDGGEKTFTQAELDQIVRDRLQREQAKYADYETLKEKAQKFDAAEEAGKTELQKAQDQARSLQTELDELKKAAAAQTMRSKVASETGVPASLLTADTEEGCKEQANAILSFAKPQGYPSVQDGGEPRKVQQNQTTREKFAEWFNKT